MPGPPYEKLWVQRILLRDSVRNEAYRQAIEKAVRPGHVVLDVGAGTGLLSLFAARASAGRVFAVERTGMAGLAREMVKRNGMEDRVVVLEADVEAVDLPETVDVIVSEWMGRYGIDEYMHLPVLFARDRWLKPGGKILPERVTAWMAPVWDQELDRTLDFWRSRPLGLDTSAIADGTAREVFWIRHHITADTLMAEPRAMWTTDLYRDPVEKVRGPFRIQLSFQSARDGKVSGLTAWFHAEFGDGITLTNAPDAPMTHWGRWVFPLDRAIEIRKSDGIEVEFRSDPAGEGECRDRWSVRVDGGEWEHHDTMSGLT